MVTTLRNPNRSTAAGKPVPAVPAARGLAMGPEFRLLGLRPREARVDIIRQAMQDAAAQVKSTHAEEVDQAEQAADDDQQLARIAAAGYHLLDPRRRQSVFERVQLLLWSEEELDIAVAARWDSSQKLQPPRVIARPIAPAQPIQTEQTEEAVKPATTGPERESQVALEVFRSIRKQDRRATALWASVIGIALSLALALSIFALAW